MRNSRTKRGLMASLILLVMVSFVLVVGCSESQIESEGISQALSNNERADEITPTDDSLIVVGVSQVGSESVWRTANSNSIQETFTTENGYFLIFNNARQKQENQIKAIRGFISQQVDYILLSPITEEGWDTVLQEAKDAGIPVILFDRKLKVEDESLYTSWVGSDFSLEGEKAGIWLENYLEEKTLSEKTESEKELNEKEESEDTVNIVVLRGTLGSTAEVGRTTGFYAVAKKHPNWKILADTDAEYTTTKGKEVMKQYLATFDQIDVVVAQNDDMMFGAVDALEEAGHKTGKKGDVIVISFDACRTALEMIENGRLNVDVECNPLQGELIEAIMKALNKGEEVPRENYIVEQVFDASNIEEYLDSRAY